MDLIALGGRQKVFDETFCHIDPTFEAEFTLLLMKVDFTNLYFIIIETLDFRFFRAFRFCRGRLLGNRSAEERKSGGDEQFDHSYEGGTVVN